MRMTRIPTLWLAGGCLAAVLTTALAQEAAPKAPGETGAAGGAPPAALRVESSMTLWQLIKSGGWAMYPLGACSMAVVWLVAINASRVSSKKLLPPEIVAQLRHAAGEGRFQEVYTLASATDCFFTRALAAGLRQVQPEDPAGSRVKVENTISETASREESRYGFYVNFLSLLTSMSPMWGLLGTVSGMIGAFSKIGAGGMGKPETLAKNIGEALVCTASGLMIAITAMGFYFLYRNILNTVMKEAEGYFSEILDNLWRGGQLVAVQALAAPVAEPPIATAGQNGEPGRG